MEVAVPLGKMTTIDKLRVLEEIWDDLRHATKEIPSPAWHADVLRARESRIRKGTSHFSDWTEAKSRIRRHLK